MQKLIAQIHKGCISSIPRLHDMETDVLCLRKIRRHCTLQARRFFGGSVVKDGGSNPKSSNALNLHHFQPRKSSIVNRVYPNSLLSQSLPWKSANSLKNLRKNLQIRNPTEAATYKVHSLPEGNTSTPPFHSWSGFGKKRGEINLAAIGFFGPRSVEAQNEIPGKNLGGNFPYTSSRQS